MTLRLLGAEQKEDEVEVKEYRQWVGCQEQLERSVTFREVTVFAF